MKTEQEVKARLAKYEAKLTDIAHQWAQENDFLSDRANLTQEEYEYSLTTVAELDKTATGVANQIVDLKWVLGLVPSYDLVPEYMQGWIQSSTKPNELLRQLKIHFDIQLNDIEVAQHEAAAQHSALITARLEELKQEAIHGKGLPRWMEHVPKANERTQDQIKYQEHLETLTDAELETETAARKLDWMRNEQNEAYLGQFSELHKMAQNEAGRRWLALQKTGVRVRLQ